MFRMMDGWTEEEVIFVINCIITIANPLFYGMVFFCIILIQLLYNCDFLCEILLWSVDIEKKV